VNVIAEQLLRLYPPAWRLRYGDEFVAMLGHDPLPARQIVDIVIAAIDAWLSSDVRRSARAGGTVSRRGTMTLHTFLTCGTARGGVTPRDGLMGAGVMLGVTVMFSAIGIVARRSGWPIAGETLKSVSFFFAFLLSMPFWLMKGQPWKAQAAIIGVTLALLAGASYFARLL